MRVLTVIPRKGLAFNVMWFVPPAAWLCPHVKSSSFAEGNFIPGCIKGRYKKYALLHCMGVFFIKFRVAFLRKMLLFSEFLFRITEQKLLLKTPIKPDIKRKDRR